MRTEDLGQDNAELEDGLAMLADGGGSTMYLAYDLLGTGGLPQRTGEYNSSTGLAAPAKTYFYGIASSQPLDVMANGVSFFYRRDVLGSTTTLTDPSGNVAASFRYDAYGNLVQSEDTVGNPIRFAGQAYDPASGLDYDRARYYDPATGRFLTPDPLGGGYAYAGDNPVNFVDPSGMMYSHPGGGGIGESCGAFVASSSSPYTVVDSGAGSGGPNADRFSWDRCRVPLALFVVSLVLAFAGLYVGDIMGSARLAGYITGAAWNTDLAGIVTGPNIFSILSLIWDIGTYLIFHVLIPAMNWLQQVVAVGEEAAEWTPPGLAVHAAIAGIAFGLGMAGLAAENCIPTDLQALSAT